MAAPLGLEPRITPPKGAVLPLHHRATDYLDCPFCVKAQRFEPRLTAKKWQVMSDELIARRATNRRAKNCR